MTQNSDLHLLTTSELDRAVEVQATAFLTDPFWMFILPDAERRQMQLQKFFRVFVRAGIAQGRAYGIGSPLQGIALWSKPGEPENFGALINAGFLRLVISPFFGSFVRSFGVFSQFERMQKQYAREPHFYLNNVGVAPEAQGKGLASKLIRPFLQQADAQRVGAYTETTTPSNVSLYEYYGFQVMERYEVPRTPLCVWAFYRPPQG